MNMARPQTTLPRVSVLTPVFNGDEYLRECIESVIAQDYPHWDYTIVNNASTDDTLAIAQSYADRDPRIRVVTNAMHVSMPQNFNTAFRLVSPESDFVKVVCADDWLLPRCLSRMVESATAQPTVGVLCCHQQSAESVRWAELPPSVTFLPGREACRLALLRGAKLFGAPTAFLYRADLLRGSKPFFPHDGPHSDTSACYEVLDRCDYGVVHEVLAVERVHPGQITSKIERVAAGNLAYVETVLNYGPRYLTPGEFDERKNEVIDEYYRWLGGALLKLRDREFWRFQRNGLAALGQKFQWRKVGRAALAEAIAESGAPTVAARKVREALRARRGSAHN